MSLNFLLCCAELLSDGEGWAGSAVVGVGGHDGSYTDAANRKGHIQGVRRCSIIWTCYLSVYNGTYMTASREKGPLSQKSIIE